MTARKIPTKPGLWLRKEPAMLLQGVNVQANVSVYGGRRLPLGWNNARSGAWEEVRDDGYWIREVRVDDVPASEVERMRWTLEEIAHLVGPAQEGDRGVWGLVSRVERDRYREAVGEDDGCDRSDCRLRGCIGPKDCPGPARGGDET